MVKIDFKTENNLKMLKMIEEIIDKEKRIKLSKLKSILLSKGFDVSKRMLFHYIKELKNQNKAYWVYSHEPIHNQVIALTIKFEGEKQYGF